MPSPARRHPALAHIEQVKAGIGQPSLAEADPAAASIERIGLLRALAWTARGEGNDLERAQKTLAEISPLVVDPYLKTFVTALTGIARVPTPASTP